MIESVSRGGGAGDMMGEHEGTAGMGWLSKKEGAGTEWFNRKGGAVTEWMNREGGSRGRKAAGWMNIGWEEQRQDC